MFWARYGLAFLLVSAAVAAAGQRFVTAPPVLVLNADDTAMALLVDGDAVLTVEHGDVQVNSSHVHGLFMGRGTLVAEDGTIGMVGGMAWHGHRIDPQPVQVGVMDNPYAFLQVPAIDEVRSNERVWLDDELRLTLQPGVYYGGLTVGGNSEITLAPGLYAFVDGDLWVPRDTVIQGEGVTLLFVGDNPGSLSFSGEQSRLELSAPTEGPLAGVVFGSTSRKTAAIFWKGHATLDGLVYAPLSRLEVVTGGNLTCDALVVDTLKVSLNSSLTVTGEPTVPLPEQPADE